MGKNHKAWARLFLQLSFQHGYKNPSILKSITSSSISMVQTIDQTAVNTICVLAGELTHLRGSGHPDKSILPITCIMLWYWSFIYMHRRSNGMCSNGTHALFTLLECWSSRSRIHCTWSICPFEWPCECFALNYASSNGIWCHCKGSTRVSQTWQQVRTLVDDFLHLAHDKVTIHVNHLSSWHITELLVIQKLSTHLVSSSQQDH